MIQDIPVNLGPRSYHVRVGAGLLDALGQTAVSLGRARQAVVISDSNVAPLYAPRATAGLRAAGLDAQLVVFPAGEPHKTLATCAHVFDMLFAVSPAIDRDCVIVALGGGVCGDLAGFVAATALRGLRIIQCPTTLLADVDSSVGGKTGVDHATGKNLIGAFHQPSAVLIDVSTLKTLNLRELRSGLAECVKHGIIRDEALLGLLEDRCDAVLKGDEAVLSDLVARNVAVKAAVVSADEREGGVRAHLNFGHTIGHAIETLAGYGNLTHGEAVALGMVAECRLAVERRLIAPDYAARIERLLDGLGLPTRRPGMKADDIWQLMQHDKKVRSGKVRIVLPTGPSVVDVFDDFTEQDIRQALRVLE